MIGRLDPARKQVTVVGAGIAGLLMADRLDLLGWEVTLLERASRVGGVIATRKTPFGNAESAVHSVLATPPVQELCSRLGVELCEVADDSRARFVVRGGKKARIPLRPGEILGAFLRAYFVRSRRGTDPYELTMRDWCLRHLGPKALEFGLDPFLSGIYAASPGEISVGAAFPKLFVEPGHSLLSQVLARRLGRLPSPGPSLASGPVALPAPLEAGRTGRPKMMAAAAGMQALVDALESSLRGRLRERLRTGVALDELPESPNLVLSTPAPEAARLLSAGGGDAGTAEALSAIRYAPLVSVTAFARVSDFDGGPPRGVGVLAPSSEKRECLGILFNSSSFPGRVQDPSLASFTAMLGGTGATGWVHRTDDEIRGAVEREMRALLGLRAPLVHAEVTRWERAIPVYSPAIVRAWRAAASGWCSRPGRVLFGNWTGQVSLRGMIETTASIL